MRQPLQCNNNKNNNRNQTVDSLFLAPRETIELLLLATLLYSTLLVITLCGKHIHLRNKLCRDPQRFAHYLLHFLFPEASPLILFVEPRAFLVSCTIRFCQFCHLSDAVRVACKDMRVGVSWAVWFPTNSPGSEASENK